MFAIQKYIYIYIYIYIERERERERENNNTFWGNINKIPFRHDSRYIIYI